MLTAQKDHPRIRGEHGGARISRQAGQGSSPHTRGAPAAGHCPYRAGRIIPAYAGSTRCTSSAVAIKQDHPRIRGEHQTIRKIAAELRGSSPHTRGARRQHLGVFLGAGIIPAYAGSTSPRTGQPSSSPDHPRIRGEHRVLTEMQASGPGSSPHTRGAHRRIRRKEHPQRIIPAYAGSTPGRSSRADPWRDHPRIRGEHSARPLVPYNENGSSPHTRGALQP